MPASNSPEETGAEDEDEEIGAAEEDGAALEIALGLGDTEGTTAGVNWYSERPLGPPQIWSLLLAQSILHRPSKVVTLPALSELPQ